jgi:hypothetical protein
LPLQTRDGYSFWYGAPAHNNRILRVSRQTPSTATKLKLTVSARLPGVGLVAFRLVAAAVRRMAGSRQIHRGGGGFRLPRRRAVSAPQSDKGGLPTPLIDTGSSTTGRVAAFAFFFHFPVVMLVFAVAAAPLQQPLMQQPTPARYAAFLVIVCLSIAVTALAAHAFAAVLERIYITIISFLKSISLRKLKRE